MACLNHVIIELDVDPRAAPIAGYITTDTSGPRRFQGWLALSSLIEDQRAAAPASTDRGDHTARSRPPIHETHLSQPAHATVHRTHPTWILMGAWTTAAWSTVAVPAIAATRDPRLIVWWALGVLAILILLIVVWTEQGSSSDADDGGQRSPDKPGTPSRDTGIDRQGGTQQLPTHATGTNATRWTCQPRAASRQRHAATLSHTPTATERR
jgi:hypothetical protein